MALAMLPNLPKRPLSPVSAERVRLPFLRFLVALKNSWRERAPLSALLQLLAK